MNTMSAFLNSDTITVLDLSGIANPGDVGRLNISLRGNPDFPVGTGYDFEATDAAHAHVVVVEVIYDTREDEADTSLLSEDEQADIAADLIPAPRQTYRERTARIVVKQITA